MEFHVNKHKRANFYAKLYRLTRRVLSFFLSCNFRNFLLISDQIKILALRISFIFILHLTSKKWTSVMGYKSV